LIDCRDYKHLSLNKLISFRLSRQKNHQTDRQKPVYHTFPCLLVLSVYLLLEKFLTDMNLFTENYVTVIRVLFF